jgi:hypothetical protein
VKDKKKSPRPGGSPVRPLFVLLFTVSVLAVPAVAAPVPKELKKAKPSVDGQWRMTEFICNGKPVRPWTDVWTIDGEKITIGVATTPFTFRDPDQPHLRKWQGYSAAVRLVDDKLYVCVNWLTEDKVFESQPGPKLDLYVFERVKDK